MGIPEKVMENVRRCPGICNLQKYCVPISLSGRDLLVLAETGTGKTVTYLLPIISKLVRDKKISRRDRCSPEGLIIAPTREMAQGIYGSSLKLSYKIGLKVSAIFGGVRMFVQEKYMPGTNILVATPGRLIDMLDERIVSLDQLDYIAFEEFDRLCDMGFLPDIERVMREIVKKNRNNVQMSIYTSRFISKVRSFCTRYLRDDYVFVGGEFGSDKEKEYDMVSNDDKERLECCTEREQTLQISLLNLKFEIVKLFLVTF